MLQRAMEETKKRRGELRKENAFQKVRWVWFLYQDQVFKSINLDQVFKSANQTHLKAQWIKKAY